MINTTDPVGARFATTANQGDLGTGTGVGVAVAQPSPFQAAMDEGPAFVTAKGDKLAQIIKDLDLKTVTPGTDGAVFAMERLDARQRQLDDQLTAGQQRATSSLQSLANMRKEIQRLSQKSVEEELEKVQWTPMPIDDPPRPMGETVKAGWFRGQTTTPPSPEAIAQWEKDVKEHREFVTKVNDDRYKAAREARKAEIEKTPEFERKAHEIRDAVSAIKKAIGDSNINEKELTGVVATVREEQANAREQQMLMEQDFNSVSAYAMNLRDAIKELDDEIVVMQPTDKDLPAKKYLYSELMTRKRTIAAIGRDLKGGIERNAANTERAEQRVAMSDTLLDNLGKVVGSVQSMVEDAEGMLRQYGSQNRVMMTTDQMNNIRDLFQDMVSKFEDDHNERFATLMNAQPQRDFEFAKKEGSRRDRAAGVVSPITARLEQSDEDIFGMLTSTGYEGPTKRIDSETGTESAKRHGLNSEELFVVDKPTPPPAA